MNYEQFRNKLIVFEGMDLTGKTSVAKRFVGKLKENNIPATFTFQPGDNVYGTVAPILRSLCKDKRWDLHELTNFFIFFADKVEQVSKVIMPALDAGKTVISDRWWYSTYAYQFYGKEILNKYGCNGHIMSWLNSMSVLGLEPNKVYYFPQQLNVQREKDNNDLFETEVDAFNKRVKEAYDRLSIIYNFIEVIPGNSVEETVDKILKI